MGKQPNLKFRDGTNGYEVTGSSGRATYGRKPTPKELQDFWTNVELLKEKQP